jgi:chromosome segregation ATPase
MRGALVAFLAAPAAGLALKSGFAAKLSRDLSEETKTRPIMKVVRMLEDMKEELNKELEDDKAVQELLECWCSTGVKEKTKAIELAESRIAELEAALGEALAKINELKSKRKSTQEDQYADQKALDESEEMRMKENKEFHEAEGDLLQAIDATENAITMLSKHNPGFAQVKSIARALETARVSELLLKKNSLSGDRVQALKDFMTGSETATGFLQIPGMQSYAPQSGQIFGILKQMKEDFDVDLADEQASEKKAVEEFEALKASKIAEIDTAKATIVQYDQDLAELGEQNAEAMKELEDTQEQLALDQTFLATLEKKCAGSDEKFEARVKARLAEIAAVEDTIEILNSDTSFEAFDKSVNSFLQVNSEEQNKRNKVVAVLRKAASASQNPAIALLAVSAQLDVFTKIKEEIDKLIGEMEAQQADEVEHRDFCIKSLNDNNRSQTAAYEKKDSLTTRIADLEKNIETLTANLESTTQEIADTQTQMGRRSETREAENGDYQATVQEQRLTQMILQKAMDRMSQVYAMLMQRAHQPGAPHTQTSATSTDPGNGPAKFKKYEENAGGKRVLAMLDEVLTDSKNMENDAIASEEDSQAAYENFMKDSNKFIIKATQSLSDMTESKAKAESDLVMAKTDLKGTMTELFGLHEEAGDLHKSCDFLLNNFELRQKARSEEMDALREAKNILSGMK